MKTCFIKGRALKAILLMCSVSHLQLFVNLLTVSCQAPLSMEYFMQKYWSGLPFPTPWVLPSPRIEPTSLASPALAGKFFTTMSPGKPCCSFTLYLGDRRTERNDVSPTALKIVQSRAYFPPCGRDMGFSEYFFLYPHSPIFNLPYQCTLNQPRKPMLQRAWVSCLRNHKVSCLCLAHYALPYLKEKI